MDFVVRKQTQGRLKRAAPASYDSQFIDGNHAHIQADCSGIRAFQQYGSFFTNKLHGLGKTAFRSGTFRNIFIAFFNAAGCGFGKGTEKLQFFRMPSYYSQIHTGKSQYLGGKKGQPAVPKDGRVP